MSSPTEARVLAIIAKTQHISAELVTIDRTFEDLKIDSLDAINIVFEVEEEFKIEVPEDQLASLRSIRDVVDGVDKLVAAKADS